MAKCACCGEDTLEDGNGNFEICSLCNWEDDPVQNSDIYLAVGANYYCLKEHQQVYLMLCGIAKSIQAAPPKNIKKGRTRMQELLSDIQVNIIDGNNWLLFFQLGQYKAARYFKPQDNIESVAMSLKTLSLEMMNAAKPRSAQQSVQPTGITDAQKEEVRQLIQSALDTGSA